MSLRSFSLVTLATSLVLIYGQPARGDLLVSPPHPHDGSPVTTWQDGHDPVATHEHQHRTAHDPRMGVKDHGGAGVYIANKVWVDRTAIRIGGNHTPSDEFAHGHQDLAARYWIHKAVAVRGRITAAQADAWNTMAQDAIDNAVNAWMAVGNASGDHNWPNDDIDEVAGTGVAWHSSVNWTRVAGPQGDPPAARELDIFYGGADAGSLGTTHVPFGHSTLSTMNIASKANWFYGMDTDKTHHPDDLDFYTTFLHEFGHVIGFEHFGTFAKGYVMNGQSQSVRGGARGILHDIDPDAVHGVRDLYAIPTSGVPEPSSITLFALGANRVMLDGSGTPLVGMA